MNHRFIAFKWAKNHLIIIIYIWLLIYYNYYF